MKQYWGFSLSLLLLLGSAQLRARTTTKTKPRKKVVTTVIAPTSGLKTAAPAPTISAAAPAPALKTAPPTICAGPSIGCAIGANVPAAQQCCSGLTCDQHDNLCHLSNGQNCSTTSSASTCLYGSVCSNYNQANNQTVCQPCSTSASGCAQNSDCCQPDNSSAPKPQSCQGAICQNCLGEGGACGDGAICCTGYVCLGNLGHKSCTACAPKAHSCTNSAQCCAGLTCQSGQCQPCNEFGSSCTGDASCCNDLNQLYCGPGNQCANCLQSAASCAGTNQCCQTDDTPQICLNSTCTVCHQLCQDCSATPCCEGYKCIDAAAFGTGELNASCTSSSCACCATVGMSCNSTGKHGIILFNNDCQDFNTTGCCPDLICDHDTNLCAHCTTNGNSCKHNSECCVDQTNLACLPAPSGTGKTCQPASACSALNGVYNAGIQNLYANFAVNNLTPGLCEVAFWSYLYHVNVFALYQYANSESYAALDCDPQVLQQIQVKMENALRVLEAVCYDNTASAITLPTGCPLVAYTTPPTVPQPLCGLNPHDADLNGPCGNNGCSTQLVNGPATTTGDYWPAYLATLPQCVNITQYLFNFLWGTACQSPAFQPIMQSAAFTSLNQEYPITNCAAGFNSTPAFPPLSSLPGGVAPAIFTAQAVTNLLAVGCYPGIDNCDAPILVSLADLNPNNQNASPNAPLQKLTKYGPNKDQVEIVQFISNVVDRGGNPLSTTLYYSNWMDPNTGLPTTCICHDGTPASFEPAILPAPAGCACADGSPCLCDPEPTGDSGGPSQGVVKPFVIKTYYDGSGCEGACWDGPCSCKTPNTTCRAVFGGNPQCPIPTNAPCICADNSTCKCIGTLAGGGTPTVNTISGACIENLNCACRAQYLAKSGDWNVVYLPLDSTCQVSTQGINGIENEHSCKALAANTYQCAPYTSGSNKGHCACCGESSPQPNLNLCCTNAQANYQTLIPDFSTAKYGTAALTFKAGQQLDCVCSDDGTSCIPQQPPAVQCTAACPANQFGCCYDGSGKGPNAAPVAHPDCINNLCCLNTVNNAIAANAQAIADHLNALLFLLAPGGQTAAMPTDWQSVDCGIASWVLDIESEISTNCLGTMTCIKNSCNIAQKCTLDSDCPNCVCDLTTGLCVPAIPLGHGCLGLGGATNAECVGAPQVSCINGICANNPNAPS